MYILSDLIMLDFAVYKNVLLLNLYALQPFFLCIILYNIYIYIYNIIIYCGTYININNKSNIYN